MDKNKVHVGLLQPGVVVDDKYCVESFIGEGGMGEVWAARHKRLSKKRVAIKVLRTQGGGAALKRFRREAEILSRLDHPHVVNIQDYNLMPSGHPFMVMEFLEGESLGARLKREGCLSLALTRTILRQVCSALEMTHKAGILHRDLKPDNIFLTTQGDQLCVKVLDFGISKFLDDDTRRLSSSTCGLTSDLEILGTPRYLSPEQARAANSQLSPQTDIFSLGTVAYEMLTGKHAFAGDNIFDVVRRIVFENPTPLGEWLPGLPPGARHAIEKAHEKQPENRHPSAMAFAEAFEQDAWTPAKPEATPGGVELPAGPSSVEPDEAALAPPPEGPGARRLSLVKVDDDVSFDRTMPQEDEVADPLIGNRVAGYIVEDVIAAGGMGVVYRARQPEIGRRVAMKVLRPEAAASAETANRFFKEAQALSAIRHRGVVDILQWGRLADGRQYLVMEYLEGETLEDAMEGEAMPAYYVLGIMEEVLDALSAAHKAGVIHRDLKPSNIFMARQTDGTPCVKLLDFGLVRQVPVHALEGIDSTLGADRASTVTGTPEYMAPEQAKGLDATPRTDIYSLGVVVYEMLAGQLPFDAQNSAAIIFAHAYNEAPDIRAHADNIPNSLAKLLNDMLKKLPEERPHSADEVKQRLLRISQQLKDERTLPYRPLLEERAAGQTKGKKPQRRWLPMLAWPVLVGLGMLLGAKLARLEKPEGGTLAPAVERPEGGIRPEEASPR